MFPSSSILMHIGKGILGFGFVAVAFNYSGDLGWWSLAPLAVAVVCFGGCPLCWTFGLVTTVMNRGKGGCVDGSCAGPQ